MQASLDQNFVKGKLGVWCVDGITTIPIKITANGIATDSSSSISYTPVPIDPRDKNFQGVWLFEGGDGKAYPANVNADGALLIAA